MDDLISRQAAIDALMSWVEEHKDNAFGGCLFHWTGIKALLENLPPAEPKKGTWIDTRGNTEWYAREYECSECGDTMLGESNFCPNCGAKMEVEHERK